MWDLLTDLVWWLLDAVLGVIYPIVDGIVGLVPSGLGGSLSQFGQWYGLVDWWFPMTEGLGMLIGYWVFLGSYAAIRWVLRAVPFVG